MQALLAYKMWSKRGAAVEPS